MGGSLLAGEYAYHVRGRRQEPAGEEKLALVGSLVLDRFLIERRIGSGGFGVVYEAWDGRLERAVAVKAIEQRGEAGKRVMRFTTPSSCGVLSKL